jgi:tryptophan halogenase
MAVPDTLAERIALFRENGLAWQGSEDLFRVDSWVQVMLGQRLTPQRHHLMSELMAEAQLRDALGSLKANIAGAVAKMPVHQAFLDQYLA